MVTRIGASAPVPLSESAASVSLDPHATTASAVSAEKESSHRAPPKAGEHTRNPARNHPPPPGTRCVVAVSDAFASGSSARDEPLRRRSRAIRPRTRGRSSDWGTRRFGSRSLLRCPRSGHCRFAGRPPCFRLASPRSSVSPPSSPRSRSLRRCRSRSRCSHSFRSGDRRPPRACFRLVGPEIEAGARRARSARAISSAARPCLATTRRPCRSPPIRPRGGSRRPRDRRTGPTREARFRSSTRCRPRSSRRSWCRERALEPIGSRGPPRSAHK